MNKEALLSFLVATIMRALGVTLRFEFRDHAGYLDSQRRSPLLFAAWHNRILALPVAFERFRPQKGKPLAVLTSASRDGELLAAVVGRFGIGAVRGSSSRRGAAAVLQLASMLEEGSDIIITPDGPRGPRYTLGPGLIFLAQKTGVPVVRVHVEHSGYWELKSWDRFRIPKPFSKVIITLSEAETMESTGDDAAFEEARTRFERLLRGEEATESVPAEA